MIILPPKSVKIEVAPANGGSVLSGGTGAK